MPQSLSAVYIHLVFSTKERRPFLRDEAIRQSLHAYLGSVSKQLECPPLKVGGVEDHAWPLGQGQRLGRLRREADNPVCCFRALAKAPALWTAAAPLPFGFGPRQPPLLK